MTHAATRALRRLVDQDHDAALAALAEPGDAEDFAALGMVALARADWAAALSALRRAGELGDVSPATALNLALAEDRVGLPGRARMAGLAAAHPGWDEPPLRLAESHRRAGERAAACAQYEQALERNPDRAEALLGLAALRIASGDAAGAESLLLRCCGVAPGQAEAWDALGIALMLGGNAPLAESAFARAQRLAPANPGMALRRIDAAMAAGTGEAELARLEQATRLDPLDATQLIALGVLLDRLGRPAEGAETLEAAVALAPESRAAAAAHAHALLHAGRFLAAVPALRHATALAPHDPALRNDLAAALNRVHRYPDAAAILRPLIAEHGEDPIYLCNLCNALVSTGAHAEGLEVARRATSAAPDRSLAWRTLANALVYAHGAVDEELRTALRRAAAALPRPALAAAPTAHGPERRLRVGLLSANLRTHPVGWLTVAAFEALDPAGFDVVCFGQPATSDPIERRFRVRASAWREVTRRSATDIARDIRDHAIDILIDLGGWGDQGMLGVVAQRAAPVQVKWVGMQSHSTGLAEMDWFLTDRWETPDGFEPLYSERLLRLPDGYVCYSPPPDAPDVAPCRSPELTFGCFNNLAKLTQGTLDLWARVLRQLPEARLLLKCHQLADGGTAAWMGAQFAARDVDPARLTLRGSSGHREQLAQHEDVDIILDPVPYSGGLTTCEALWMGVPVVTLPSQTFASRHSASHLSNVGLADWVAADADAYVGIAVARGADRAGLAALRQRLRPQMRASPLCDALRFGRNLGDALRAAWRDACRA